MNKVQVTLDRHKLCRVEDPSQETQKLKSKVRTEFKEFCVAIGLAQPLPLRGPCWFKL